MELTFRQDPRDLGTTPTAHPWVAELAASTDLSGARVLVPLRGGSADLLFLAEHAAEVVGVEASPRAVVELFDSAGLTPTVTDGVHRAGNVTVWCRDLLDLGAADLGPVDLVHDRNALTAFPDDTRDRYTAHLTSLCAPGTRYFLTTLEYRPTASEPPFSVGADQVHGHFAEAFSIDHAHAEPRPEHRLMTEFGLDYLVEHGFLMTRR